MFIWKPFSDERIRENLFSRIEKRINDVCESWIGTPYMKGQRCKDIGVDCVQFTCAILDELNNRFIGSTKIDRLASDTGANDKEGIFALRIARQIMKINPCEKIPVHCLQPGDILICRLGNNGGPGHTMFVGGKKNLLYHACNGERQVTKIGLGSVKYGLHAYRFKDRINWLDSGVK